MKCGGSIVEKGNWKTFSGFCATSDWNALTAGFSLIHREEPPL
jgi:hypothetical protein